MNLYNIHPDPKNAPYREWAFEKVPALVWYKYQNQPAELKKREKVLAKDPQIAYRYAATVLKGRFRAGEAAIAKDPDYAYYYAFFVLKGPWPAGEAAIRQHEKIAFLYSHTFKPV